MFRMDAHTNLAVICGATLLAVAIVSHAGDRSVANAAPSGKAIFASNCASCHQVNGQGVPGTFPPLAGNRDVVAKDPKDIIKIALNGLNATKTINGKEYHGGMPSWKSTLSNADIAAVLTYIRNAWGNKAPAVSEKQVAAVNK